jgi:hypothetical protein
MFRAGNGEAPGENMLKYDQILDILVDGHRTYGYIYIYIYNYFPYKDNSLNSIICGTLLSSFFFLQKLQLSLEMVLRRLAISLHWMALAFLRASVPQDWSRCASQAPLDPRAIAHQSAPQLLAAKLLLRSLLSSHTFLSKIVC